MAEIKVLDKHTAELIAAGEVVERPASVIKELVENSIDAGASVITVEIKNGGVTFMRVTDNGCGIEREYVATAFLRHATSKITTQSDLDSIMTLGFRGEALASISAVSHIELLTKTAGADAGTRVVCDGGEISELSDAGCPAGTTIIVRELFYNTPARMKFLKKDVTEGNAVAGVLDKIALSHPEISFRLIRDGKEVLHTPGDNKLRSGIYAVFGRDFTESLIPVDYELGGIKIYGFITMPSGSRPNRTMQNFFINGRFVRSRTANVALEEAFKGSVQVGRFPGCVLHMEMNFSSVDVNVHPAKLEVRFVNERPIFDAVYHAVKSALTAGDKPKEMKLDRLVSSTFQEKPAEQMAIHTERPPILKPNDVYINAPAQEEKNIKPSALNDTEKTPKPLLPIKTVIETLLDDEVVPEKIPEISPVSTEIIGTPQSRPAAEEEIRAPQHPLASTRIIGEAFGTYMILQYGSDKLMLIDKHAAHERLLYEKLRQKAIGMDAQALLVPVTLTLEKSDYDSAVNNIERFAEAGFEIDDFGSGAIVIRSAPLILQGEDIASAAAEIAHHISELKSDVSTDYMDWVYHNVACRAAMKAGDKSTADELIALANELESNPGIRYCPHGRPVYTIIKKRDIERQFGRI